MTIFIDPSSNFHPYECDGPSKCVHCDRVITDDHDPSTCALCDDGREPTDTETYRAGIK